MGKRGSDRVLLVIELIDVKREQVDQDARSVCLLPIHLAALLGKYLRMLDERYQDEQDRKRGEFLRASVFQQPLQ